jgi:hypothetical protein
MSTAGKGSTMIHKPDPEPSFTEQAFRIDGDAMLVIGLLFMVAGVVSAQFASGASPGEDIFLVQGFIVGYGALIGFLIMLSAPAHFAIAEALGCRSKGELVREWEIDRFASAREAQERRHLAGHERDG